MNRYHCFGEEDFRKSPSGRWVKWEDVEQLEGKQKYHDDAIQSMRLACDMRIEQLESALTEIADFGNNRHASGKYLAGMAIAALPPEEKT